MEELMKLREEINKIDENLIELFTLRMDVIKNVAVYKAKNSMEVLDKSREIQMIEKHMQNIENKELTPYAIEFLEHILEISKKYQREIIKKNK